MLEMGHASRRLAPLCLVLLADRVQHALGVYRASVLGKDAPDESMRGVYPSPLFQSEFRSGVWQGAPRGERLRSGFPRRSKREGKRRGKYAVQRRDSALLAER